VGAKLLGMGFEIGIISFPVTEISGGWRDVIPPIPKSAKGRDEKRNVFTSGLRPKDLSSLGRWCSHMRLYR